jgi:hypothetical protein
MGERLREELRMALFAAIGTRGVVKYSFGRRDDDGD